MRKKKLNKALEKINSGDALETESGDSNAKTRRSVVPQLGKKLRINFKSETPHFSTKATKDLNQKLTRRRSIFFKNSPI